MATVASADRGRDGSSVHIDAEALVEMVGRVGTSATTAFAVVAVDALPDERGAPVATTSARSLARQLHVAKDTAAGLLGLLSKCGYLRRLAQPRSGGRFAPARYVVKPPAGFTVLACPASEDTAAGGAGRTATRAKRGDRRHRGQRTRRDEPSQIGLFDTPPETTDPRSRS